MPDFSVLSPSVQALSAPALLDVRSAPIIGLETLRTWGHTLVVAPHPDDESLGCGGTLALLAQLKVPVSVVWVSDGAASHPGSQRYPPPALAQLRAEEAKCALDALGVGRQNAYFLDLPDGALPFPGENAFEAAFAAVCELLQDLDPQTLLLPWRRDPHRDHRAAWQLFTTALRDKELQRLEYLVWAFERATPEEWPRTDEARAVRVPMESALARKRAAIDAHTSQVTNLIDDTPHGFWLSPAVIAHFEQPYEAFIAPFSSHPEEGTGARPAFETLSSPLIERANAEGAYAQSPDVEVES